MKTLLTLLLLIPSLSWGNVKVIYCYLYETSYKTNEADGIINQMIDNKSFKNSESILYYEINDKRKELNHIKNYYELRPSLTRKNTRYSFRYFDEDDAKDKQVRYNKNEIATSKNYKNRVDERDMISFLELDRITGIMIHTWGIYIDENGDRYSENLDDEKFYEKDDSYAYSEELNHRKYICEPHKGL